jgi:hypothetical protein
LLLYVTLSVLDKNKNKQATEKGQYNFKKHKGETGSLLELLLRPELVGVSALLLPAVGGPRG